MTSQTLSADLKQHQGAVDVFRVETLSICLKVRYFLSFYNALPCGLCSDACADCSTVFPHLEKSKVFQFFHFTLSRFVASSAIRTFVVIVAADFLFLFSTEAEDYESVRQVLELSVTNTTYSAKVAMKKTFKQSLVPPGVFQNFIG